MKKRSDRQDTKERKIFDEINLRSETWNPEWRGNTFIYEPMFGKIVHLYVGLPDDMVKMLSFGPEEKGGDTDASFAVDTVARVGGSMLAHPEAAAFTVPHGNDIYICMRRLDLFSMSDQMALQHECLHAAYTILHRAGVEFGDGAEILARMQGFIFSRLIENIVNGCRSAINPDGTFEPIKDIDLLMKGV